MRENYAAILIAHKSQVGGGKRGDVSESGLLMREIEEKGKERQALSADISGRKEGI